MRLAIAFAVLALLTPDWAPAQGNPALPTIPLPPEHDPIGATKQVLDDALGQLAETVPLLGALGPTGDGAIGAALVGNSRVQVPGLNSSFESELVGLSMSTSGYFEFGVDGLWATQSASNSVMAFALRPGINFALATWPDPPDTSAMTTRQRKACEADFDAYIAGKKASTDCPTNDPPTYLGGISLFGDVRYRFASVAVAGAQADIRQSILGGGLDLLVPIPTRWPVFREIIRELPRVGVGYYAVQDTETSLSVVPVELDQNFVQAHGRLRLNIPILRRVVSTPTGRANDYPLRVYADYSASRATTGPVDTSLDLWSVQLLYDMGAIIVPVISYRSGAEFGLDYERQWIFGAAWQLAGNRF